MDALIFSSCLGLNISGAMATQISNPSLESDRPGATEITACRNLTTTEDGALESIPALVTAVTHTAPVTALSAGKRFLYQDASETKEWDGTNVFARFPAKTGAMVHTPIDCRVGLFKSPDSTLTMVAATVGTNPNPATSRTFAAMPAYNKAFVLNSRLYAVNTANPRFLQYSEEYHYDLWNYGDGFIGHNMPILETGAIPGRLICIHANGVSSYGGSGPHDFVKTFYSCLPVSNTLFSGFISKALGYGHIFLCTDGIYFLDAEGTLNNLTDNKFRNSTNSTYLGATVEKGKFLALGNLNTVEYDFITKAAMYRDPQGMAAVTLWKETAYFGVGELLQKHSGLSTLTTSVTFPYTRLAAEGRKGIQDLYITGRFDGAGTITATGLDGKSWTIALPALGTVYDYRLKTPKEILGNHISFTLATTSGAMRLEKLRATINQSQRTR